MKKATSNDNHQEGQEQSRRLYRTISDSAKRLDDAHSCAQAVADLFSPKLQIQRSKLQEYCERLIFTEPALFGRKAEELLWRKCYYDVIASSKKLKGKEYSPGDLCNIQAHINAGIGHYHHFMSRVQSHLGLELKNYVDFAIVGVSDGSKKGCMTGAMPVYDQEHVKWAEEATHRSLVYLGDLNRYKLDIYPNWDSSLAMRYYMNAVQYKPQHGIPHNQMGTLASSQNRMLDAVYHYMCALSCKQTFDGTERNLSLLFEKNARTVGEFPDENSNSEPTVVAQLEPPDRIKRLIGRFLLVIDTWYLNKKHNNVYTLCHLVNVDLQECLTYAKSVVGDTDDTQNDLDSVDTDSLTSPSHLSDESIFKITVICLLCVTKIQRAYPQQLTVVIAFTLSIYSQLLQKVIDHVRDSIMSLATSNFSSPLTVLSDSNHKLIKSKTKVRRRRKKNLSSGEESDTSDVEILEDSNSEASLASSDDEFVPSSAEEDSDEENNCATASPKQSEGGGSSQDTKSDLVVENNDTTPKSKPSPLPVDDVIAVRRIDQAVLLDIVAGERLLQSIKVLSDWFGSEIEVIKSCGKTTRPLFRQMVQLLNLINVDVDSLKLSEFAEFVEKIRCNNVTIPLPEDAMLNGVEVICDARRTYDGIGYDNFQSAKEEALLRIDKLVHFGRELVKFEETGVTYDAEKRQFDIQMNNFEEVNGLENGIDSALILETEHDINSIEAKDVAESKHNKMKHMGQLWLAAEVRALENRVRSKTSLSPYLVLDVDCLITYIVIVKSLVQSKKCIIVVPSSVISALDDLKKEKQEARDAIRWLELQFHHGNRFCRAQRPQESTPLPLIKYPKKKDRKTFTYIQIIECCHFLTLQQKNTSNLVTLLFGNRTVLLPNGEAKEISLVGMANSVGINLEFVGDFYDKWRKSYRAKK